MSSEASASSTFLSEQQPPFVMDGSVIIEAEALRELGEEDDAPAPVVSQKGSGRKGQRKQANPKRKAACLEEEHGSLSASNKEEIMCTTTDAVIPPIASKFNLLHLFNYYYFHWSHT